MHWGSVFASNARVGALIAPAVDPISGQPELKCAPVRVRRYEPKWYGFALSREPLALAGLVVSRHVARRRLLALRARRRGVPASWAEWADGVLGSRAARIEFSDVAGGRYRGANVADERLQACLFVATAKSLPSRTWLATLFGSADVSATRIGSRFLRAARRKAALESGPVVCSCFAVGRSTLLRAIRGDRLVSVEQIGKALQAGTNCGSCIPELKGLLAESAAGAAAACAGAQTVGRYAGNGRGQPVATGVTRYPWYPTYPI